MAAISTKSAKCPLRYFCHTRRRKNSMPLLCVDLRSDTATSSTTTAGRSAIMVNASALHGDRMSLAELCSPLYRRWGFTTAGVASLCSNTYDTVVFYTERPPSFLANTYNYIAECASKPQQHNGRRQRPLSRSSPKNHDISSHVLFKYG